MTNSNNNTLQFVIIPKLTNVDFFDAVEQGCKERAEQLGENLVNCHYIGSPNVDATEQATIVKELITNPAKYNLTKQPDGISISVIDENITGEAINYAHDSGIPIITFDSDAPDSKRETYIGTDNLEFGIRFGKVLNQVNPLGSYYGIITSDDPNLQLRVDGVRKRLEGDALHPTNWKEVDYSPFYCNNNISLAIDQMYQYASDPNINAVISVGGWPMWNESLWTAFVDITASNPISKVVADATSTQVNLMNRDYVDGLVGQMPYLMGNYSVDELLRIVQGREIRVADHIDGPIMHTPIVEISRVPHPMPEHIVDENLIGNAVIFGYIAFSIVAISSISVAIWVWFRRDTRIVRSSQPYFLIMICMGTLVLGLSIIPLTADDHNSSQRAADAACMSFPWILFLGFTTVFSALFSKTWRIHQIFNNAKLFKRIEVKRRDVILPYFILMTINVITLLCWTFISPLKYVREPLPGTDDWNRVIATYGTCSSAQSGTKGGSYPYLAFLFTVAGFNLIIANVYGYRSRHIETEYSESKCIAIIMASVLQLSCIGFPIVFLTDTSPIATFIVLVSLIFMISMDILCFLFIPKFKAFHEHKKNILEEEHENKKRGRGVSTGLEFSMGKRKMLQKWNELDVDEKSALVEFMTAVTDSKSQNGNLRQSLAMARNGFDGRELKNVVK